MVWDTSPEIVNLGTFHLPFPVAIWGIIVAIIAIFYSYPKIIPEEKSQQQSSTWKFWGLIISAFIGGQLIFLIFPSPEIQQIGPIRFRWYGLLFASSFVIGSFIMHHMYNKAGFTQEDLDRLLMFIIVGTVIGARLGHVLFYDFQLYLQNPLEIIKIWNGGLASHGAAIGILLAIYFYVKKYEKMSFFWLADRVVVPVSIGGALIRLGNFMNSEIVGQPTDLSWGIVFARRPDLSMVPRHPSMLYEALLCLFIFAIIWYIYKHYENRPPEGAMFSMFLVTLFGGRFFLEYLKHQQAAFATGALNMGQWLSIPLVAFGLWLLFRKVKWSTQIDNKNLK
ncbi:prolipoprotein diacylglyceryl transferase [Aliifodinibius halophilus]|uniref:Phosphatidylglycerol--prolipoprotein diacylglyceryl transferase n=2 Tax=Fodinibius halophilus TaxID=1736908 RepID=A0A6M1T3C2_9BACT|nr:prolipoprotein diacylglyceryl transferase [Fodinibius halophilus]